MKAILVLEDGHTFAGKAIGSSQERCGEVILNTAVVGYQEMMTDPANAGKILVLTYPLIGNYGTAPKFNESNSVWISGLVIKEESRIYSNWQAKKSFDDFTKEHDLPVISGIDTRTLTVHLRQKGSMLGIISTDNADAKFLLAKINEFRKTGNQSRLPKISVNKITPLGRPKAKTKKIAILDLGVTNSVIRQLEALGLNLTLLPFYSSAQEILKLKPDGLIISGGPEDDIRLDEVVLSVKPVINRLPILGIATGHQVLARALGAKVVKMKLGHRGVNYPVRSPSSYKGEITVQNHSYVVDADSLTKIKDVKITGFNLNDQTVEEMESKKLKLIGAQYVPASPGFNEVNGVFKRFVKLLTRSR